MKRNLNILFIILMATAVLTCRKKTTIKVTVWNYALNEPIANATVAIIERRQGGLFNRDSECHEIAHASTNNQGECSFEKEKLRSGKTYDYFFAVTDAYGIAQSFPCGGKTGGFIDKGKTQSVELNMSGFDAFLVVQYNKLLNPSQPGDSLVITIASPKYQEPGSQFPQGGGGVFYGFPSHGGSGFPFPDVVTTPMVKTNAGKNTVHIRKTKNGIVSTSVDTVKIYPGETRTVSVNW